MALVTQTDLDNASTDASTLAQFVNGAAGNITSRLGRVIKTLAQLAADVAALPGPVPYVSGASGAFSTTSTAWADIPDSTLTVPTTGRPVLLVLQPDGVNSPAYLFNLNAGLARFDIIRDTTVIVSEALVAQGEIIHGMTAVDVPAAGTHYYKCRMSGHAGLPAGCSNMRLVAIQF